MADKVDTQTRSRMMASIKGKDTRPELVLRRALHARGLRYRLHAAGLPGKPDMVFNRYRAVVFVHGCFWHRHTGCRFASTPSSRIEFWQPKFDANVLRDRAVRGHLLKNGWRVATVWECALRKPGQIAATVDTLSEWLVSADCSSLEIG